MSKKDYQAIARAINHGEQVMIANGSADDVAAEAREVFASLLADVMEQGNPRFDRARFLEACRTGKCKGMRPVAA